jgi:nucleotide-binding universal stress UspA family protein
MYRKILVPIELRNGEEELPELKAAVALAQSSKAAMVLMTVLPDFGMAVVAQQFPANFQEKAKEKASAKLKALADKAVPDQLAVETLVREGTIYKEIIAMAKAKECDLVVTAAHRAELADFLLGPNSAKIARHAHCSVLVVR